MTEGNEELPGSGSNKNAIIRGAIQAVGGAIPFAGGIFSAAAGAWSEQEQKKVNEFLHAWVKMLQDELREKQETILEITARLDIHDEEIAKRIKSEEYQSLVKKTFRNWAGTESVKKREFVRNILANAASSKMCSDDVVKLFLDWLQTYSEFHFAVIGEIYRHNNGVTRSSIWRNLGKQKVREDSADADLYKLLIRDLSTGGIIRQHRETDYYGNYIKKQSAPKGKGTGSSTMVSAFDDNEQYVLTELGKQFVHYAMTDLPLKIQYQPQPSDDKEMESEAA